MFLTLPVPCAWKRFYFLIFLHASGFSAGWIDHRGTRGAGGYWRWRYGRLGKGIIVLRFVFFSLLLLEIELGTGESIWILFRVVCKSRASFLSLIHRHGIKRVKWVTCRRSTCSSRRPAACWVCCSPSRRWTVDHTPQITPLRPT